MPGSLTVQDLVRNYMKQGMTLGAAQCRVDAQLTAAARGRQQKHNKATQLKAAYGTPDTATPDGLVRQLMSENPSMSLLDAQCHVDKFLLRQQREVMAALPRAPDALRLSNQLASILPLAHRFAVADLASITPAAQRMDRVALYLAKNNIRDPAKTQVLTVIGAVGESGNPNLDGRRLMSIGGDSIPRRGPSLPSNVANMPVFQPGTGDPSDPGAAARRAALQRERDAMWTGTVSQFSDLLAKKFALPVAVCNGIAYRVLCTQPASTPYVRAKMAIREAGILPPQSFQVLAFIETLVKNGANCTGV